MKFVFIILLLNLITVNAFGESPDNEAKNDTMLIQIDYPKRLPARTTWEKIASFPGAIMFIPFQLTYWAAQAAMGVEYEVPFVVKIADLMIADDGSRSLLPTYGPRRGGGVKYKQKNLLSSQSIMDITATVGLRNRSMYRFRFRDIDISNGKFKAGFLAKYTLMPDEKFYGLGMKSDEENESNFAWEQISVELSIGKRYFDKIKADVFLEYQRNNILKGRDDTLPSTTELYNNATLPGLEAGIELAGGRFEFAFDSKNHPGKPTAGWEILLSGGALRETDGNRYGFWESSVDIKRYFHLFYGRYLIFRAAVRTTEPFSKREVPFFYYSQIGRWSTIRGFTRGRFRDRDLLLGSIEYRWPLMPKFLDASLFIDAGQVGHDLLNDFSGDDFEITYGIGLIGWQDGGTIVKAEIGKSSEQIRFNLKFN